ncbi:aldo/keto reductase [Chromohalobacter japonicus]|uniref:aldo/keto reductase n=1 Tax=Chromohalobacter japonicus TaxID=223900 RepID=UPI001FF67308|nr:aldo/keto reductase [Chromohalobacter japonicus]MCK0753889.1 aldo/keto reductase [Chromohalobacter japonicus]
MIDDNNFPGRRGPISRRTFLQLSAGAGLLAALGPTALRAAPDTLNVREIPASGQRIPVIGLGTARTFNVDPDNAAAMRPLEQVLQNFYDGGGRLVDSSPMYGRAETVVGRLAERLDIADDLFMATKVWTRGREAGVEEMATSRERMGGGHLDLIQVHNLVDLQTQLDTLKAWRDEGRVRYIGVTHYTVSGHDRLTQIVEREPIDFVQFNYNILTRDAEKRLLPAAADNGVATLINEPFERGSLFGRVKGESLPEWTKELGIESWAQLFLKFIVSHPAVTCAIPATSDPEHTTDNIGAAHGPLPDADQRERMASLVSSL